MKTISEQHFEHSHQPRIGVLLTNLGTPNAPQPAALRIYLKQFLSDPRVVEIPRLLWWFILNVIILNIRPRRSAAAYRKIWTEQGSPLMVHSQSQTKLLAQRMAEQYGDQVIVDLAMRYGKPSIPDTIRSMLDRGVTKLLVLPLYPQYSAPTTASTFDAVADYLGRLRRQPELRFINHYHDFPPYIEALANSVSRHWETSGRADKLIFSYHGEPQNCLDQGDPYFCECHKTSRLLAERLGLEESAYITTFQSRFGAQEWLKPYTDTVLQSLPEEGVRRVQILCPGFSADCLETLEEIDEENRGYFMEAGGEQYEYIPCLNSDDEHISAIERLVTANLAGWLTTDTNATQPRTLELAKARGAQR